MASRGTQFVRALEPLVAGLWILFVLVSIAMGTVWIIGIGEASLEKWVSNTGLRAALGWLLARGDIGWITLGAANVYASLAGSVGLPTARRWALTILAGVIALGWISAATGFPLGHIRYGSPLGLKLGPVPLGLPLLWFTIIIGAREGVGRLLPRLSHGSLAAAVGVLVLMTDLNLEPLAAQWRGFWFWAASSPGGPPDFHPSLTSGIAWGLLAGGLTWVLREQRVMGSTPRTAWRPAVALAIFNGVFLLAHGAHALKLL
jgi:uncharacterized membrane protein